MVVLKQNRKCPRYGRDNHKLADCYAKHHFDGTVLHVMGNVEEIEDIDEEVSSELSPTFNTCCNSKIEELMFIQPCMPMAAAVRCYVPCREAVPCHRLREAAVPRRRRCTSTAAVA